MGTRNLTCVLKDGEFRVAQYCQWDGYPTGQGRVLADFLMNRYDPELFAKQLDITRQIDEDALQAKWKEAGADGSGWVNMEVSEKFRKTHPHLERSFGAKILEHIQTTEKPELRMDLDFAGDSLFCEWAYVLNLDTQELEVYKGFNKDPLESKDRFFFLQKDSEEYKPIRLFKSLKLSELAEDTMSLLEKEAYGDEE